MQKTLLSKIPIDLEVIVGSIRLSAQELVRVRPGQVLEFDSAYRDIVDVHVNGSRIARGQLLALDDGSGKLAVTILEISSAQPDSEPRDKFEPGAGL